MRRSNGADELGGLGGDGAWLLAWVLYGGFGRKNRDE